MVKSDKSKKLRKYAEDMGYVINEEATSQFHDMVNDSTIN